MSKTLRTLLLIILFAGLLFGVKTIYDNLQGERGFIEKGTSENTMTEVTRANISETTSSAGNSTQSSTTVSVKEETNTVTRTDTKAENKSDTKTDSQTKPANLSVSSVSSASSTSASSEKSNGEDKSSVLTKTADSKPEVITTTDGRKKRLLPDNLIVTDMDGNNVNLRDFEGKKMIINIWASWCGPCKAEMPDLMSLESKLKDDEILVMINSSGFNGETPEKAKEYLKDNGLSFKNMTFDEESYVTMVLGADVIPTSLFVDSDGYVVGYSQGAMSEEKFRMILDQVE